MTLLADLPTMATLRKLPMTLAETYPDHLRIIRQRMDTALEDTGFEHVLIYSGRAGTRFLDDDHYTFKSNPHFRHWVPLIGHQDGWIVYTPGETPTLLFHRPEDFWYLPPEKPTAFWVEHVDLRFIGEPKEARAQFPSDLGACAVIGELPEEMTDWGFANVNDSGLVDRLHYDRATKTPFELECIRGATTLAVKAHLAAERAFKEGCSEYDIHMSYLEACDQREEELPYNNIVALNQHAAVLHYQYLDRKAPPESDRHSLLIDAGAMFNGYASDITRTYSYRDEAFGELIQAMDSMQQELCASLKPGTDYRELHLRAHALIAQILADFGLVNLPAADIVSSGISSSFYPHGLGHYLGLQVHDVGGFMADPLGATIPRPEGHPFLRLTRVIDVDQVMTIEPGVYFIEPLLKELRDGEHATHVDWNRVDELRKFGGVRIEDNVRITADGHDNLTREEFARQRFR